MPGGPLPLQRQPAPSRDRRAAGRRLPRGTARPHTALPGGVGGCLHPVGLSARPARSGGHRPPYLDLRSRGRAAARADAAPLPRDGVGSRRHRLRALALPAAGERRSGSAPRRVGRRAGAARGAAQRLRGRRVAGAGAGDRPRRAIRSGTRRTGATCLGTSRRHVRARSKRPSARTASIWRGRPSHASRWCASRTKSGSSYGRTHHLHIDGWSWPLVFRDLSALYEARRRGEPAALPRACAYGGYLAWLRNSAPDSEAFWRRSLAGFAGPTRILPSEGPFAGDCEDPFGEQSARLPAEATSALHALARSRKLTLNTVVQAAWGLLLGHWSGDDDVTFGAAFSGRPAEIPGIEAMVGPCVNNLPVRIAARRSTFARLLVARVAGKSDRGGPAPVRAFDQIQEWAGVPWRLRLFDSLIVFQNYVGRGRRATSWPRRRDRPRLGARGHELSGHARGRAGARAPHAPPLPPEPHERAPRHRRCCDDLAALLRALCPPRRTRRSRSLLAQLPAATREAGRQAPRRHAGLGLGDAVATELERPHCRDLDGAVPGRATSGSTTTSSTWAATRSSCCAPMRGCANGSEPTCRSWRSSSIRRCGPWRDTWLGLTARARCSDRRRATAPPDRRRPSPA